MLLNCLEYTGIGTLDNKILILCQDQDYIGNILNFIVELLVKRTNYCILHELMYHIYIYISVFSKLDNHSFKNSGCK